MEQSAKLQFEALLGCLCLLHQFVWETSGGGRVGGGGGGGEPCTAPALDLLRTNPAAQ